MGTTASTQQSSDIVEVLNVPKKNCTNCSQLSIKLDKEKENSQRLEEENQILKIRLSDLEIENSEITEDLNLLESQLESFTNTNGGGGSTTTASENQYQQLIETKNKSIQNLEAQLVSQTKQLNEMKLKNEVMLNKFKLKIQKIKEEYAMNIVKIKDETKRYESENSLLNESIKMFAQNSENTNSTRLIVELSNHINEKDTVILQMNNDLKEKDSHISLLEKKLKKYKAKIKRPEISSLQNYMQQRNSAISRNNSAPSPRLLTATQHVNSSNSTGGSSSRKNNFIIKEFAFETEILSDNDEAATRGSLFSGDAINANTSNEHYVLNKDDLLDSSISSISD